jgi:hypothetical protein
MTLIYYKLLYVAQGHLPSTGLGTLGEQALRWQTDHQTPARLGFAGLLASRRIVR